MTRLLEATGLRKRFAVGRKSYLTAVDGVDLGMDRGTTLGLVGESGSGKSTAARLVLRLIEPDEGRIVFDGADVTDLAERRMGEFRRQVQMVFQDPRSSFDPTKTMLASVAEPLAVHTSLDRAERRGLVLDLLRRVGLDEHHLDRRPDALSGGQRQRAAIARALATSPALVVCDEAVSALDVSVQAQIVNLLRSLQDDLGVSYIFISHDLAVVRRIADEIAVMYLGKVVENGPADRIHDEPRHPYTAALVSAIPNPRPSARVERFALAGDVPNPLELPVGCRFHPRCPMAMDICREVEPPAVPVEGEGFVACHLHSAGVPRAGEPVTIGRMRGDGS